MAPLEPRRGPRLGGASIGILALALVVGLVAGGAVGWLARGGGGTRTETVVQAPTTAPRPPATPAQRARTARASIRLAALNGTQIAGLAARTARRARSLGYRRVTIGNGPEVTGRSEVWYVSGALAAAQRVAQDFRGASPRALPAGSPLRAQVPGARVFLLLGPQAARLPARAAG